MPSPTGWHDRVARLWAAAADLAERDLVAAMDALVAERDPHDADALFEAASARDYAGLEPEAEPLYRRAIAAGLGAETDVRARIQLASTLRNLGRAEESVRELEAVLGEHPDDEWTAPAAAFLGLALVSRGSEREAAAVALAALASLLPQYGTSVRAYAAELLHD